MFTRRQFCTGAGATLVAGFAFVQSQSEIPKVPFIAPLTGAMALRDPFNRYAVHLRASYNHETALIVKQLTHLGLHKIAVFLQNDAYGKARLDGVAQATVERNSVEVAAAFSVCLLSEPRHWPTSWAKRVLVWWCRRSRLRPSLIHAPLPVSLSKPQNSPEATCTPIFPAWRATWPPSW